MQRVFGVVVGLLRIGDEACLLLHVDLFRSHHLLRAGLRLHQTLRLVSGLDS